MITPTRDVGRTRKKLVNHEPKVSDLQTFPPTVALAPHAEAKIYTTTDKGMRKIGRFYLKSTEQDKSATEPTINLLLLFLRIHHSAIITRMTKQLLEAFVFVA